MASATIGNLNVRLGLDSAEFQNGAKKAQGTLSALKGHIQGFAAGVAGALTLGAVGAAVKGVIDNLDEMSKASQKAGMSTEAFSKLAYAASLSDVSTEDLVATMAKFSKALAEIEGGGKNDAGNALKALGISAVDSAGKLRSTTEILADVADKFSEFRDGANKTALAMALFGKSGAQMIPLLNGGRQGLKDAADEAERLGVVIDTKTAQAAEQFNDDLTRLQTGLRGLAIQGIGPLIPALSNLTDELVKWIQTSGVVKQFANDMTAVFYSIEEAVLDAATVFGTFKADLTDWQGLDVSMSRWKSTFALIQQESDKTTAKINALYKTFNSAGAAGKGDLPDNIGPGYKLLQNAPGLPAPSSSLKKTKMKPITIEDIRGEATAWDDVGDSMKYASQQGNYLNDVGQTLGQTFSSWISDAISGTFDLTSALANLAGQLSDQFLQTAFGNLFGGGASVAPSQQGGGFLSNLLGGFSGFFADGGSIPAGKWGVAGETGMPEIVKGPGTVIPPGGMGGITIVQHISASTSAETLKLINEGTNDALRRAQGQQPRVNLERQLRSG